MESDNYNIAKDVKTVVIFLVNFDNFVSQSASMNWNTFVSKELYPSAKIK